VVEIADGLLGVGAAVVAVRVLGCGAVDEHAIARLVALHVRADGFDFATRVGPRNERQRGLARVRAGADVDVHRIHADGSESHDDLIGGGLRIGKILELQHFRTAMRADENRLHAAMLS
jgi:hypothetical protein